MKDYSFLRTQQHPIFFTIQRDVPYIFMTYLLFGVFALWAQLCRAQPDESTQAER